MPLLALLLMRLRKPYPLLVIVLFTLVSSCSQKQELSPAVEKSFSQASYGNLLTELKRLPPIEAFAEIDKLFYKAAALKNKEAFTSVLNVSKEVYAHFGENHEFYLYLISIIDEPDFADDYIQQILCSEVLSIYHSYRDYANCKVYLNRYFSIQREDKTPRRVNNYTTYGLIYLSEENYTEALKMMQAAVDLATVIQHKEWIGLSYGNLAYVYFKLGNYAMAKKFADIDKSISLTINSYESAAGTYNLLASIALEHNDYPLAKSYVDSSFALLSKWPEERTYSTSRLDAYRIKSEYYKRVANIDSAYKYLKALSDLGIQ